VTDTHRPAVAADGGYLRSPNGERSLTAQFSVKMEDDHAVRLVTMANRSGKTVSAMIREILIDRLTRRK
jgi:hypothetical protein